jgi:hypothetical protein
MTHLKLTEFDQKKKEVLCYLEEIHQIAEELEVKKVATKLKETMEQLHNEKFMLSVVGEFSGGKSTFINALLGEAVLPMRTKPSTAFINKIQYGSESGYSIVYRDKRRGPVQLVKEKFLKLYAPNEPDEDDHDEVKEYQEVMKEFDEIKWADIRYPTEICKEGIDIYDTPGVNDPNPNREEITFTFVPKSDAVVLVLSATTPLAKSEMDFLKDRIYASDISKVFFVANFKDRLVSEEAERKSIHYITKHLSEVEPNPKVYLVSSRDALTIRRSDAANLKNEKQKYTNIEDTGFPALEAALGHFFQNEKAAVKLSKPVKRGIKYAQDLIRNSLALRVSTLNVKIDEIQMKIDELRPKVRKFVNEGNQIADQLRNDLMREMGPLREVVKNNLENMKQATIHEIDGFSGDLNEGSIKELISSTTRPLQTKMQQELANQKKHLISAHVSEAYKKLNKQGEFLDHAVKETFQINIEMDQLDLSVYDDGSLMGGIVIGSLGLAIGALIVAPILLPLGFLGALIFGSGIHDAYKNSKREQDLRSIKGKVQNGFDKNRKEALQKFEKEWMDLIHEIVQDFQNEFHEKALLLEEELNIMIREKQEERWSVEEQRRYYEGLMNALKGNSKKLHDMLREFQKQKVCV